MRLQIIAVSALSPFIFAAGYLSALVYSTILCTLLSLLTANDMLLLKALWVRYTNKILNYF